MKFDTTRRVFAIGLLGALTGGCAGGVATGAAAEELTAAEYQLGAGDQVRVTVFGEADLTGQYVVSSQGTVAFPLVGDVQAAGMTINQFGDAIAEALRQGFIRQPNVGVEVVNYRPFYILGEVRTPGTYPYSANLTVLNAVATAQGFTYRANTRRVYIKHPGENDEREYRLTTTTPVRPGDTIRIAERLF